MKVLEVSNISKSFGDFQAVSDISFSIEAGKIFGLLGPNGAGKTTAIRMIMNIIAPDSGSVSVLGNSNRGTAIDNVGYLPEERGMYRKMRVDEMLLFQTSLKSMKKKEAKAAIDKWLGKVNLMDWKKKKVEELSKGMQQKIQFIGTILHNPKLLILDEPFGGLDPINQNLIKDLMLEVKKNGTTIIFSTHVMDHAEKICDEIFLINKSKKILYGKLEEIKQSFGRENVLIEFDGNDEFLQNCDQVKKYNNYGKSVEVQLIKGGDSQELLKEALSSAFISKFVIKEPSLHDIFIETVGKDKEEGGKA